MFTLALGCTESGESHAPDDTKANAGRGGTFASGGVAGRTSISDAGAGGVGASAPLGGSNGVGAATSSGGSNGVGAATSSGGASGASNGVGPITCRVKGDNKSTLSFINNCSARLSFSGSKIESGELLHGEHACRDVGNASESLPALRYWAFTTTDPGNEKRTLAELTLNTDFNDFDWYNISHVDAHNLPMQIVAVDMNKCRTLTCAKSLLADCPSEGQLRDDSGNIISCFSPNRDDPNSVVAQYFEASCDDAYSWSGDDKESVVACAGEDYDIVFCP
jgi:hypothetical protein